MEDTKRYTPLPAHTKPADFNEFLAAATEQERLLHQIAARFLGSSYFMDRTHGYNKWLKAKQHT